MATSPHTVAGLVGDLKRLGVAPGDVVMVHASLRAVGPVDGGAAGLVAALDAAAGPSGSLLMTVGARDDWAWVNERPEAERAALLAGSPPFDARAAAADPDTVTAIHFAEYLADVPSKRRVRRHRLVHGPDGPVVRVVGSLDDSDGIVDHLGPDYFGVILGAYLQTGAAAVGVVGCARSELLAAADFVRFAASWMTRHLGRPS